MLAWWTKARLFIEKKFDTFQTLQHAGRILRRTPVLALWLRAYLCICKLFISRHNEVSN